MCADRLVGCQCRTQRQEHRRIASPLLSHPPCHLQALMDAWQPAKASLEQPLSQAVLQVTELQQKTREQVRLLPWERKLAKKKRPAWL